MYKRIVLAEDTVLINWAAEKVRGMRPEVLYKKGETVSMRVDVIPGTGTVYTIFHMTAQGLLFSNSRLVDSKGSVMRKYNSYVYHTRILTDMTPAL